MSRTQPSVPAPPQPWRTAVTAAVFAALFVFLGIKLHEIQVEEAAVYSELGERQRSRTWTIRPRAALWLMPKVPHWPSVVVCGRSMPIRIGWTIN